MELIIWILVIALAVFIDITTSNFIFSFLAIGAIVAAILSFLGVPIIAQIIVFLVVGIVAVSFGYPWAKKKFNADKKKIPLMEENYIGKIMIAPENIVDKATIKVEGIYWTVLNKGSEIQKGNKFKITGIEGTKLVIEKEED